MLVPPRSRIWPVMLPVSCWANNRLTSPKRQIDGKTLLFIINSYEFNSKEAFGVLARAPATSRVDNIIHLVSPFQNFNDESPELAGFLLGLHAAESLKCGLAFIRSTQVSQSCG